MTTELTRGKDPPPISTEVQKVTIFNDGGWKAVIEETGNNSQRIPAGDYELSFNEAEGTRRSAQLRR